MTADHGHRPGAANAPSPHAADVDIAAWSTRFDLLSDPHRLEILIVLHRRPGIIVGDLAAAVGRTETAVSQALRVLRHQGWVSSTRQGRSVSYRLDDETVHQLLHWMGAGHS
ncbi:metalloregulator ArsR/SmtB family transcription factor [Gordonia sp. Z-3]|uniref:Metalloregulator ArsR/SmtB family transcription factor n=1 Tax=Gordonia tangerina TaxID=2911060 RepID=A0ABS9DKB7_9ACTN|nr:MULTISPECIES: metalloregulator ArsR/SmtB family transcription factor [Gordonia]MCF3939039.1 metalloregulator ArsR/SmtB family transcription factor [Gordonia tangerina]MED5801262.1 metalloregulator ArsR/SmtB family transcription factor [Gordonia sp. Z-3]